MIAKIKEIISMLFEVKALLVFFGITGFSFIDDKDDILYYIHTYQIHWLIITALIIYYVNMVQKKLNTKIEEIYIQQQIRDLKTKTLSAYKQYGNSSIEDKLVADYVLALEQERSELKVNSFTQAQLAKMVSNINYEEIGYQE